MGSKSVTQGIILVIATHLPRPLQAYAVIAGFREKRKGASYVQHDSRCVQNAISIYTRLCTLMGLVKKEIHGSGHRIDGVRCFQMSSIAVDMVISHK